MIQLDYKNRPVLYFGNNIAIVKDSENCFIVATGLFIDYLTNHLNYREISYFAKSKEEAEEIVRKIIKGAFYEIS